jgi:hypothetical protein
MKLVSHQILYSSSICNFEMNFILIKLMVFINKKNMRKRDRERMKEKKRKFFFLKKNLSLLTLV